MSLRLRLTVWLVAVFMVIQVALGGVVLLFQLRSIRVFFSQQLQAQVLKVRSEIRLRTPGISSTELSRLAADQLQRVVFERFVLTVYNDKGELVVSSAATAVTASPEDVSAAMQSDTPIERALSVRGLQQWAEVHPDARHARMALVGFRGTDGRRYVLLGATADTYAQRVRSLTEQVFLIAMPIGALAAGVAGWVIAGIGLGPIRELREIARTLSPQSIGQRIELHGADPEVQRLQSELDAARSRLEEGFRAQERFMANVSHELKTPIAVLLTEAQTLAAPDESERMREFIESVQDEMIRLGRTVESLLTLTRVRERQGAAAGADRRTMINELVLASVDACESDAKRYRVRLEPRLLEDSANVDAQIRGDEVLLRTMLDNLVRNAIRFSPAGERVTVTASIVEESAELSVTDRGPGIPADIIENIFDRFVQAKDEERRARGHGLGLAIAHGVAELHGGSIRVRNLPDAGCEFVVWLEIAGRASDPRSESPE
ncbi:MAG: hypothetical protein H6811_01395 [Phycisphaeraceae bacterium]|nr:hypothetical protein [Phycisphaeraceae bacterium]